MRYFIQLFIFLSALFLTACQQSSTGTQTHEQQPPRYISPILDPIFQTFNIGFSTGVSFPFVSNEDKIINVGITDLLLDKNLNTNARYQKIKNVNINQFVRLQKGLQKSKFLTFWLVKGWKEKWFDRSKMQELMDAGYIPVFSYWYFGDTLIYGVPDEEKVKAYHEDNQNLARFLAKLKGKKMLIMEPEFNKAAIIKDEQSQSKFATIISDAIDTVKAQNPKLLVSISIMDSGARGAGTEDIRCQYAHCALGDKRNWVQSETVIKRFSDKLDFISFHQMIGSFSRDYNNLGTWDNPNPRTYSDTELGIDYLHTRILNLCTYLHDTYKKPVFIPFMATATATWDESNDNNKIEPEEISPNAWVPQAQSVYNKLRQIRPQLRENGLFGFAVMSLFDHPRQDYGGYQYFMNNEYHLGIIGSGAIDTVDLAPHGDLYFKDNLFASIFEN